MIYDFKKADAMMAKLGIDPLQLHLLMLLYHRQDASSSSAQLERFKSEVLAHEGHEGMRSRIDSLEEKNLLMNVGNVRDDHGGIKAYNADQMIVSDHFISALIAVDCGEELWLAYPATFPLSNGEKFLARTGDKDEIIADYQRRIRKDVGRHKHVLEMLEKFKRMTAAGKINGMKIENFIISELWETLEEIDESQVTTLGDHAEAI
jgi:hypothetical protein